MHKTDTSSPEFQEQKERLKVLLKKIKTDEKDTSVSGLKQEFKDELSQATPMMIALAEQELVDQEGFSRDDLLNACDIHLELFREAVDHPELKLPLDHPVTHFQEDHKVILELMDRLLKEIRLARKKESWESSQEEMSHIQKYADLLMQSENHNVRQENTLFPILERHGLEQPPAIMWMEHTEMKQKKKQILALLENYENKDFLIIISQLESITTTLIEDFAAHTTKEQNILYVAALDALSPDEWADIKEECDNLGYFTKEYKERS